MNRTIVLALTGAIVLITAGVLLWPHKPRAGTPEIETAEHAVTAKTETTAPVTPAVPTTLPTVPKAQPSASPSPRDRSARAPRRAAPAVSSPAPQGPVVDVR